MSEPLKSCPPSKDRVACGALRPPCRCEDARARGLWGLPAERVAQTLILKGGLVRHPLDLHADPMASPWPALGLLSITCCSCCRCVPGRINSRPGAPKGVGGGGKGRSPVDCWGRCPEQCVPSPRREACAPGRATCLLCFRGLSRLSPGVPFFRCPLLSSSRAPARLPVSQRPAQAAQSCIATLLLDPGVLQQVSFYPPDPPPFLPGSLSASAFHSLNQQSLPGPALHWNTEVD